MAIGKRGKYLGIQLRDEHGKTFWARDGSGQTLTYPDTEEGRKRAELVQRRLVLDRDERKLEPKKMRDGSITVAAYFNRWQRVYPRRKKSSNILYAAAIRKFVDKYPDRPMGSIERFEAADFIAEAPWRLSPIRAMFADAEREQIVPLNPFSKLPSEIAHQSNGGTRKRPPRENMVVLTEDELDRLVACAYEEYGPLYGPIYATRIIVAAYSALRPGELDALKWDDIDFDRKRIVVREQWSARAGEFTEAKTDRPGERRTPEECGLLPPAEDALRLLPGHLNAYFAGQPPTDRLFMTKKGRPFTAKTRSGYWNPVRERFGREHMDFYELRHFCATWLLIKGFPSYIVAAQLRHKDNGRLVEERYGKPQQQAALDTILNGIGGPQPATADVRQSA